MKPVRYLAILLLVALEFGLNSCKQKPSHSDDTLVLDLPALMDNKGEIKISDFCESVDFVALQPNDAWFFPNYSISCKVLCNYVLFADEYHGKPRVGIFKRTGEFLLKLDKQGKGPGEYVAIEDFGMDPEEKKLWVLEGYKATLHWYDLNGNWTQTIKLPTDVTHVRILPNGDILAQNIRYEPDSYDSSRLFLTDNKGRFIRSVWNKTKNLPDYSSFLDANWLFETSNDLYYRDTPNTDTLYKLNRNFQPEPFLVMDPGKLRIPQSLLEDFNRSQEWFNYLRVGNVYCPGDHLLLTGGAMNKGCYFWIDRKTGASVFSEKITDDLLGLNFPFEGRSVRSDYLFKSISVQFYKDKVDRLFVNENPLNKELQDKLRKTLADAPENLDKIMIYFKVRER